MSPCRRLRVAVLWMVLTAVSVQAEEWTRFRGPNGSGVSRSTGLPIEFGPDRHVVWRVDLPFARSSPVFNDDSVFLTAIEEDAFLTLAVDRDTGTVRWSRSVDRDRTAEMYKGTDSATPSPVTDGASVYAFFQETGLVAYTSSGEERWRLPLGPFRNFYGLAASPILAGDRLILLCDQTEGSFLLAVDTQTGEEVWRQERTGRVESYSTPVLYPGAENPRRVLVAGSLWVDAYDLVTGKSVWALPGVGTGPVSSPVLLGDLLFVNMPDQAPEPPPPFSSLLAEHDGDGDERLSRAEVVDTWMENHYGFVDHDGDGALSAADWDAVTALLVNEHWGLFAIRIGAAEEAAEILWQRQESVAYIPTTIAYRGVLYMVKDGIVTSFDLATGNLHKRGRLSKGSPKVYASPVAGDGKIYIATLEGAVGVITAEKEWQVLAMNELGEEIYATPAILDGGLYVRTRDGLFRFGSDGVVPAPENARSGPGDLGAQTP